ncbi:unknown [Roseburia sp. CAG:100]|nr:unknown [Roseburia sp. CAG:100]
MFYIVYNSRTWLGDTAGKIVFCNVADVRPGSNICTEADTDNAIYTHFFKPAKDTLVFIWIVGGKSRGNQKRYFLTFCQISKEFLCIVVIASGIVFAGIKAGTTTDAFIPIDLNNSAAVFFYCAVCCNDRTDRDAFVTTNAIFIGIYEAFM